LWRLFRNRVLGTICPGWLWTTILISASIVRITGMSHQHLAQSGTLGMAAQGD
jgi:hypothetical protein